MEVFVIDCLQCSFDNDSGAPYPQKILCKMLKPILAGHCLKPQQVFISTFLFVLLFYGPRDSICGPLRLDVGGNFRIPPSNYFTSMNLIEPKVAVWAWLWLSVCFLGSALFMACWWSRPSGTPEHHLLRYFPSFRCAVRCMRAFMNQMRRLLCS